MLFTAKASLKDRKLSVRLPFGFKLGGFLFKDKLTGQVQPLDGVDPTVIGYDGQLYKTIASIEVPSSSIAFAASGSGTVQLPRNKFITELLIVADPYRTQGDGVNVPVIVEDAQDKLMQSLSIVGGPTYYAHSDSILYGKALGNLNKYVYGNSVRRDDISVSSAAADHDNYESWRLHFGALDDYNPFDISSGIPAEDEGGLNLNVTFSANNVQATIAARNLLQTGATLYVVVVGVNGLPKAYRDNCPIPDFRTDIKAAPTSTTTFDLLGSRFLKRSTIINQAVAASNNNPRNMSNITSMSITLKKPTTTKLLDAVRANIAQALVQSWSGRLPGVDANGTMAVVTAGFAGVFIIDWRKITGNPFGLDTYALQDADAQISFAMGTTTGQISAFHEYYAARSPVGLAAMRSWGDQDSGRPTGYREPFQAV